jgi:hypothetical protein
MHTPMSLNSYLLNFNGLSHFMRMNLEKNFIIDMNLIDLLTNDKGRFFLRLAVHCETLQDRNIITSIGLFELLSLCERPGSVVFLINSYCMMILIQRGWINRLYTGKTLLLTINIVLFMNSSLTIIQCISSRQTDRQTDIHVDALPMNELIRMII